MSSFPEGKQYRKRKKRRRLVFAYQFNTLYFLNLNTWGLFAKWLFQNKYYLKYIHIIEKVLVVELTFSILAIYWSVHHGLEPESCFSACRNIMWIMIKEWDKQCFAMRMGQSLKCISKTILDRANWYLLIQSPWHTWYSRCIFM